MKTLFLLAAALFATASVQAQQPPPKSCTKPLDCSSQMCINGQCYYPPPQDDKNNCGAWGNVCPYSNVCRQGKCCYEGDFTTCKTDIEPEDPPQTIQTPPVDPDSPQDDPPRFLTIRTRASAVSLSMEVFRQKSSLAISCGNQVCGQCYQCVQTGTGKQPKYECVRIPGCVI